MKRGLDMDAKFDVIVIGAGNAGLVAALELVKNDKKVLVLDSNSVPGGFATSFIRGRFEFDASLNFLNELGSEEHKGELYHLFSRLGILEKMQFANIKDDYHVYFVDSKENYKMPFGVNEFIEKMEEYVPGCRTVMKKFFIIAKEAREALLYIEQNKGKVSEEYLKREYINFMKVATFSLEKVLNALKMPKKAQEILTSYWVYLGSPISTLSFISFASRFYAYISFGAQIPLKRSHEISLVLAEEIEKLGGVVQYYSTVDEILFKNKKVAGVKLTNDEIYEAEHIISSVSPTILYGKMLPSLLVPKEAVRLTNSRVLGARGFSIYLGLNQSAEDLGLHEYSYMISHSSDSDKEFQNMSSIKNKSSIAIVLNNAIPNCSPKGTTLMCFTSLFFGDAFSKNIKENNYFEVKEKIAKSILDAFENTTGIIIQPYIEEIEIASPLTFARYGNHPDGAIFGYKVTGLDNVLPRLLRMEEENFIPNLRTCGGFSILSSGYNSTYLSGELIAKLTLQDIKEEEEHDRD